MTQRRHRPLSPRARLDVEDVEAIIEARRGDGGAERLCEQGCVIGSEGETASTAYHEAGHAVARAVLGLPFEHVSIVPEEDSVGHLTPASWHDEPDGPEDLHTQDTLVHATAWFAGIAAESAYIASLGGPGTEVCAKCLWGRGSSGDTAKPEALKAEPGFYSRAWDSASSLIERNEDSVHAVASRLLESGTLQQAEVLAVMGLDSGAKKRVSAAAVRRESPPPAPAAPAPEPPAPHRFVDPQPDRPTGYTPGTGRTGSLFVAAMIALLLVSCLAMGLLGGLFLYPRL